MPDPARSGRALGPDADGDRPGRRSGARDRSGHGQGRNLFQEQLSVEGSYVWRYDASDLSQRRGEAVTTLGQGWTEPPGTPAVGLAYLAAFKATGRPLFMDMAKATARALLRTQLESGGWQALLEFDPVARAAWCYRADAGTGRPDCEAIEGNKLRNVTNIDDNISQASLTFLIRLDSELRGEWGDLRKAAMFGLEGLLEMQYPNGSWPVRSDFKIPDALTNSAWRARYPAEWSRTYVEPAGEFYITNDHVVRDTIRMFLLAADTYREPAYLATARRAGDFLLAARLPESQPGWAQTYNPDLEPIWGRKFEPPAIAAYETASSIEALLELYAATGERRYLEGIDPPARWLEQSRLPEGDWARFYELETNRPLYFDADYQITHDGGEAPDHYSFRGSFGIPSVLERYRQAADGEVLAGQADVSPVPSDADVEAITGALDDQGRWVEDGLIHSGSFVRNLAALASFAAAEKGVSLPDYIRPVRHKLDF
ncbi:MAG: hypothetical protein HC869_24090 [Rhodospirillales bacterium]|nr:hypothetical protein [Rhodospirillales bacterium]